MGGWCLYLRNRNPCPRSEDSQGQVVDLVLHQQGGWWEFCNLWAGTIISEDDDDLVDYDEDDENDEDEDEEDEDDYEDDYDDDETDTIVDIDELSYEELLALGETAGKVSEKLTGLWCLNLFFLFGGRDKQT